MVSDLTPHVPTRGAEARGIPLAALLGEATGQGPPPPPLQPAGTPRAGAP